MKAALAAMMLTAVALPELAFAQLTTDAPREIYVHPAVTTAVHLPEAIEHMRFTAPAAGMMQGTFVANLATVRPRRGLSPGTTAWLQVTTATMQQRFRLRVVARAADADRQVVVLAPAAARADEGAHAGEPAAPRVPPATTTSTTAAPQAPPAPPLVETPSAPPPVSDGRELAAAPATTKRTRRFELAAHAVASFPGFTALELDGYEPDTALQFHNVFGLRLAVARPSSWWALETNVSGEWPAGPMTFDRPVTREKLDVTGPLLRMEVGMRARLVAHRWSYSAYAGLGGQTQLRRTLTTSITGRSGISNTMNDGVVLALGLGLHRQLDDILVGLDFQVRRGGPDEYRSVTALWTVGYLLAREKKP